MQAQEKIPKKDTRTRLQKRKHGISLDQYRNDFRLYCRRGEEHCNSKLTEVKVREIRAAPESVSNSELAVLYGVNVRTIWDVRNYATWANVN
jgi:hypothetical protein